MLQSINLLEWLKLFVGIFLFLGPGFCVITILYYDNLKNLTHWFVSSITVSTCFLGVFLAWLKLINFRVNFFAILLLCISGWLIGLIYLIFYKSGFNFRRFSIKLHEVVLWIITVASGIIVIWILRHQVAGLGSDSYHHTLIAQLIYDNGGLPNDYQPATDKLISFSYHYGYHAVIAALMWLSSWGSRLLVLVSGALLVMMSILSVALLTNELTEKPYAGIIAGAFTGFVFVFPIHLLDWGRYTQLTALTLLPVFLDMIISFYKINKPSLDIKKLALFALVAAGIAITHYRVTIMVSLAMIFLLLLIKEEKYSLKRNYKFFISMSIIAGLALFLFSPWLWRVYQSHQIGYSIMLANINPLYYSISRFGSNVLNYPTNLIVLAFLISGLIWGIVKRKWFIIWISIWTVTMLLLSGPNILSGSMDRISVIVSLYIPAAIVTGWFIQEIYANIKKPFNAVVIVLFLFIFIWSGFVLVNNNLTLSGFVTPDDLAAAEWIKANTPVDAYFAENTYRFDFSSNFVIGIDAGYWLPLLADRRTVTIPMIFNIEKFKRPDGLQQLLDLYDLGPDLTTHKAMEYLQRENISYIYIGELGGQIDVNKLLKSPNFALLYQKNKVLVFKVEY